VQVGEQVVLDRPMGGIHLAPFPDGRLPGVLAVQVQGLGVVGEARARQQQTRPEPVVLGHVERGVVGDRAHHRGAADDRGVGEDGLVQEGDGDARVIQRECRFGGARVAVLVDRLELA